jgi:GT2 family glycosyltransferase
MTVAAVTVHFGDSQHTKHLVDTLRTCNLIESITVVLHDSYLNERNSECCWIEQPNRGYAAGLNAAVREIIRRNEEVNVIFAFNPDVLIEADQIVSLYSEHFSSGADCTFPMLQEDHREVFGYRFSNWGTLLTSRHPDWFSGACFLFSVHVWKKLGGFDERYFHYFEDRDFCIRARAARFQLHQASSVIVRHQSKSGINYSTSDLPRYSVGNHLVAARDAGIMNPITFGNIALREFLYLFRWKKPWSGIPKWLKGIEDFLKL